MITYRCCGPKLSLCGLVLSAWGILQLSLMALAFYVKSVALIDDLPIKDEEVIPSSQGNIGIVVDEMNKQYEQQALNCSIAAGLYLLTLLVSIHQFRLNNSGRMNSN